LAMGAAALVVPLLAAASRWPVPAVAVADDDTTPRAESADAEPTAEPLDVETGQPVRAWLTYAVAGVGLGAFAVVLAALPAWSTAGIYAAVATLIAAAATATMPMIRLRQGATLPTNRATALVATAGPPAIIAVGASAPAWLTALFGPYQTLRAPWTGYADTPLPPNAEAAAITLALLTFAAGAAALALGGRRYVFAAALPPAAAFLLVLPTALHAPRPVTAWVAFIIALATGLGAALVRPTVPAATKQLRTTAGIICALTGAAGIAGSLATHTATLVGLGIAAFAAGLIALLGRDPVVRRVAWLVASAAALALPVTAAAAVGTSLRTSAFGVLAVAAVLVGLSWVLARPAMAANRPGEAAVVELGAYVGSAFALLLTLDSLRYTAAVLMVWGILLGAAALRRDRTAQVRIRLVLGACLAELGAVWLLMAAADVAVIEAYTVPFALVAVIAGAIELRYREDLSSWLAYGPALAAGFLPTLLLAVVGEGELWRRVALFIAGVAVLALGAQLQLRAPTVIGAAVAIIVALHELVLLALNSSVAGYFVFALGGLLLLGLGATFEKRRRDVVRIRGRLRQMS
ncbi:SCO7613 C-terminal domain-containing membrane protein, partial [Luedemannella flava]|uniref:SCO7613 C-terminal domain-containing membrane protein n=1 Tax=Luedemannella flava TaxID=349316 RepID=UPI003CD0A139